ncbi:hypothetical protein ACN4EG_18080 [Alkalinema pantanalense CENA528]|uniref:hypothetical protein n=1 Tax=Alkalinema pantanalense TaxID=1620705 RepID=UPI003D6FBA3E
MQITIDLPKDLEQHFLQQAEQLNIPLRTLVIQALRQLIPHQTSPVDPWPDTILNYQGDPEFPAFESYRNELLP